MEHSAPDFVILTLGRTGSQYLVTLLDSHPAIACAGEIMGCTAINPEAPETAFAAVCERSLAERQARNKTVFGFKLPWMCAASNDHLLQELAASGTRFVLNFRKNKLSMYLSMRLAQVNNDFSSSQLYRQQSLTIDIPHMQRVMQAFLSHEQRMLTATRGLARTIVSYEAAQADPDIPWVQDLLGVEPMPLRGSTTRARSGSQRATIENYDEVATALRDTPFAAYLDEVGAPA